MHIMRFLNDFGSGSGSGHKSNSGHGCGSDKEKREIKMHIMRFLNDFGSGSGSGYKSNSGHGCGSDYDNGSGSDSGFGFGSGSSFGSSPGDDPYHRFGYDTSGSGMGSSNGSGNGNGFGSGSGNNNNSGFGSNFNLYHKKIEEMTTRKYQMNEKQQTESDNYCIIRTYSAGVFAGELVKREGKEVTLKDARRIWYWDGAASLSQLAMEGTSKPENCKFPCEVDEVILTEAIEILPCTAQAQESIKSVNVWKE